MTDADPPPRKRKSTLTAHPETPLHPQRRATDGRGAGGPVVHTDAATDSSKIWKAIGRLEARDEAHETNYRVLAVTVATLNSKVDGFVAEFHNVTTAFADVMEFVREEKEHRAELARQVTLAEARQVKRDAELNRRLQSMLPILGAVVAIILTGAWQKLGNLSNSLYWSLVVGALIISLTFYFAIIRRGGEISPAPVIV